MAAAVLCGMCQELGLETKATVLDKWPQPVCHACDKWLTDLGGELKDMEEQDPELRRLGQEAEEAYRNLDE
jgi:hypothetical protein